ncbi:hypothetical protein CDAR_250481 [Caerostris darwini]|uniref:Uncharacterized protein n=1 Tax=Caerostris darwini TaxID=1538125 RepID=A0AAV4UE63_9ARAC|nr:hypothetical protein CDAR_250481 [Caerostris darwini]
MGGSENDRSLEGKAPSDASRHTSTHSCTIIFSLEVYGFRFGCLSLLKVQNGVGEGEDKGGAYRWIEYEEILRQGVSSGGRTREPSKLLPIMMNSSEGRIASSKYTSAKRIASQ